MMVGTLVLKCTLNSQHMLSTQHVPSTVYHGSGRVLAPRTDADRWKRARERKVEIVGRRANPSST